MLSTPRVTDEIFKATPFNEYKGIIDREETYLEALGEQFDLLGSNSICSHFMETIGFQLQPLDPFPFCGNDWVATSALDFF